MEEVNIPQSPSTTTDAKTEETVFQAVWIGGSGISKPQDIADLQPTLSKILRVPEENGRLKITNDTNLLASPLYSYPDASTAVVVIAGTGSNVSAFRKAEQGTLEGCGQMGGWGWILGNEGSGFDVGKEALQLVLRTADQASCRDTSSQPKRNDSQLEKVVFAHFGIQSAYELFSVIYAPEPASQNASKRTQAIEGLLAMERKHRISTLTPAIFDLAFIHSDSDALSILHSSSHRLAQAIQALVGRDNKRHIDPSKAVLCFGGSLVGVESYRQLILDDLKREGIEFLGATCVRDAAAEGAQNLARTFENLELVEAR